VIVKVELDPGFLSSTEKLMALFDDLQTKLTAMQATATTIQQEITTLKQQVASGQTTGDMTPAQEQQLSSQIDALQTALNSAANA